MKKIIGLVLSLAMLVGTFPIVAMADEGTQRYSGGKGTAAEPYLIANATDLNAVATNVNADTANTGASKAYYMLTADIDLNGAGFTSIGLNANNDFRGTFNGNGHCVKNFKINDNGNTEAFFGHLTNATISNFGIENVTISTAGSKAGMVGRGGGNTYTNCYVKGLKTSNNNGTNGNVGGFIADLRNKSTFTNCYVYDFEIEMQNLNKVGGFVGNVENGNNTYTFTNCYTAKVNPKLPNNSAKYPEFYPFINNINRYVDKPAPENSSVTVKAAVLDVTNCYAENEHINGRAANGNVVAFLDAASAGVEGATKTAIVKTMTDSGAYTVNDSVNDGYPYTVSSQIWTGVTDTVWAGDGSEQNPYKITSAAELAGLAKTISDTTDTTSFVDSDKLTVQSVSMYMMYTGKYFELTTDIDLNNVEWTPIGRTGMRFNGVFNGNGHVVKNVKMTNVKTGEGLFGAIGKDARILNLGVDGVLLNTNSSGATDNGEQGSSPDDKFKRCSGMGGLVGIAMTGGSDTKPMIDKCYAKNVTITAKESAMGNCGSGGLVGAVSYYADNANLYISNSYTYKVNIKQYIHKGAFIGANLWYGGDKATPHIKNCYAGGNIQLTDTYTSATMSKFKFAFGYLNSNNSNNITNCYTSSAKMNEGTESYVSKINFAATAQTISNALVKDGGAFKSGENINGGYPALAYEQEPTVLTDRDYIIAAVSKTDNQSGNKIKVTVWENDEVEAEDGAVVYVAVYDANGRFVTMEEHNYSEFTASNNYTVTTNVTAAATQKIKVFVWNASQTPLADFYTNI